MPNLTKEDGKYVEFLSADQFLTVYQVMCFMWVVSSILGIVTNSITIHIFLKMGLEDGVILSFHILAVTDICFVISRFIQSLLSCMHLLEYTNLNQAYTEPLAVTVFISDVGHMLYLLSTSMTASMAVAGCTLVMRPRSVNVRRKFSKTRSSLILTTVTVFILATFIPLCSTIRMTEHVNLMTITPKLVLWTSGKCGDVYSIVNIISDLVILILAQIIIVVCVIIMTRALYQSHQLRQILLSDKSKLEKTKVDSESYKHGQDKESPDKTKVDSKSRKHSQDKETPQSRNNKLRGKELQVVQQVVLISIVFIVTNTPKIVTAIYAVVEPDLTQGRSYQYVYNTCTGIINTFNIINSSVKIFIYLMYNSKFRQLCGYNYVMWCI